MNLDNSPARIRAQLFCRILLIWSAICLGRSTAISSKNTANWPQMAADGGFLSENYNAMNSAPLRGRGRLFLANTSESGPISDDSEIKTGQNSNAPATNKSSLVIHFKNNQALSPPLPGIFGSAIDFGVFNEISSKKSASGPLMAAVDGTACGNYNEWQSTPISLPLLCIFTGSQQSKAKISKIDENSPEAAVHMARPDGAPFISAKTRYAFQSLTAVLLCRGKNSPAL